jgi:DNA invertase Pin-like site-specific DNA recombinase
MHNRSGILRLLEAAKINSFDAVIAETMSRIGRDEEDRAAIRKRLAFAGVELRTPTDGVVTALTDGIRAVVDAQQIRDLKGMIRRGMSGVIRDGRHAGGRGYGYRPIPGKPGELQIVEREAAIVRRIFGEYVEGCTPREIAASLNRDGVSPPRGIRWAAATINGNKKRHHGILLNELYAGRAVWNRVRMVLNPDTGRRVSRANPAEEWMRAEVPHLRIVQADLFDAAQQRKAARTILSPHRQRKAKYLLSGLLKCGCCGGGMSVKDHDHNRVRLQCSTMKESASCSNRKAFYLDEITGCPFWFARAPENPTATQGFR